MQPSRRIQEHRVKVSRAFLKAGLWLCLTLGAAGAGLAQDTAWVLTTDYSSFGRARGFAMTQPWAVSGDLATIPGDAVARHHDGLVYVVGRGGANLIQVYDPAAGFGLVREFSLGSGLNPQDIAFDTAGEAYVSCYDQAVLLRVDVAGETILGSYPTAAYADADSIPETGWLLARGDKLYIECQKLDRNNWYAPTGPGQLLVFDMASEAFLAPIDLVGANPYTEIEAFDDGHLRVGCAGVFGVQDGGIESIDTATGTSLGFVATESQLGGDITTFASTSAAGIHVVISDANYITSLRRFDLNTELVTVVSTGSGYVYAGIAFDGACDLYLADRTPAASGLRVFDVCTDTELTTGALATGLAPFQIVLPTLDLSPVPGALALGNLKMAPPFPNPCNPRADITLRGHAGEVVSVGVFDVAGRRLLNADLQLDAAGSGQWVFGGRDGAGRNLPAGVYRVAAQSASGFAVRAVTLLK